MHDSVASGRAWCQPAAALTSQGSSGPAWMDENLPLAATEDRRRLWSPPSAYSCSSFCCRGPIARADMACKAHPGISTLERIELSAYISLDTRLPTSSITQRWADDRAPSGTAPLPLSLLVVVVLESLVGMFCGGMLRSDCDGVAACGPDAAVWCERAFGSPPVRPSATAGFRGAAAAMRAAAAVLRCGSSTSVSCQPADSN